MSATRGIKMIGRLQPATLPSGSKITFITVYDFPDGRRRRLRFGEGDFGFTFDLPESEVRRLASVLEDWLSEEVGRDG